MTNVETEVDITETMGVAEDLPTFMRVEPVDEGLQPGEHDANTSRAPIALEGWRPMAGPPPWARIVLAIDWGVVPGVSCPV